LPTSFFDFLRFQYNTSPSKSNFFYTVLLVSWSKALLWLTCRRGSVREAVLAKRKNSDPVVVNPQETPDEVQQESQLIDSKLDQEAEAAKQLQMQHLKLHGDI